MINSSKIPIHRLTQKEYSEQIFQLFGKGRVHASLVYSEWMRTMGKTGSDPHFKNAEELHRKILEATDFETLQFERKDQEGETTKILFKLENRLEVETVYIPMQAGGTLCVSSQVGCRMGCTFCETGRMGLFRNLTAQEIVLQVLQARSECGLTIRNVVFMGMGEPFDNYEEVMQAVHILSDSNGLGIGPKHITISTSGLVEGIRRLSGEDLIPNLAISISSASDEKRSRIMPINRKHSLKEIHDSIVHFTRTTEKSVLIAYVLMKGVNDSIDDANQLVDFLKGLHVKVNLIPYNAQSNARFERSEETDIESFISILRNQGLEVYRRGTKGDDIMAACGQLGNVELRRALRSSTGL